MTDFITIDGRLGEGGGQILRSSLALSAITGRPFTIEHIRAKRRKPGLLRQHLTAVRAAATIANAELEGDALGSGSLRFCPGAIEHGEHRFAVGSAGSAMLVLQTVLWPLLVTPGRSTLVLEGGTHNPMAPPFEFITRAFLPLMRRLGVVADARLEQAGFYPAGGGRVVVELEGGHPIAGLSLDARGAVLERRAEALIANLPGRIGKRELACVRDELGWSRDEGAVVELRGRGPGNALCLSVTCEALTEVVTAFGSKGVAAEEVARRAVAQLRAWLDAGVPVGEHLADQLLIPMALAASASWGRGEPSSFVTLEPSDHTRTNAAIIGRFVPASFAFEAIGEGRFRVSL
ncbi:RNA 3'-terminal-phosphate cyclase [Plesiocystis pacifica SIR-1]|uniref:RNA 3'-terminal phosphate cyclase n=1 Tax=Plesiocystis pacifica SIR-1 TaxID=391625 RepID=A6GBU8_9BACT|nr:RNA 3'-terminal phosphate cyclase [Plesiocystis pacifica]EDM76621.1 RNA 3'-terminal-phosphate cyclase [Plesiocystis pacifica SIR-1]